MDLCCHIFTCLFWSIRYFAIIHRTGQLIITRYSHKLHNLVPCDLALIKTPDQQNPMENFTWQIWTGLNSYHTNLHVYFGLSIYTTVHNPVPSDPVLCWPVACVGSSHKHVMATASWTTQESRIHILSNNGVCGPTGVVICLITKRYEWSLV